MLGPNRNKVHVEEHSIPLLAQEYIHPFETNELLIWSFCIILDS